MRYDGTNLKEVLKEHAKYLISKNKDSVEHLRADFSNTNVYNINFIDKNLISANFESARISGCCFLNSFLDYVNFKNCRFNSVEFIESKMERTSFAHAYLYDTYFILSSCYGADFSNTKMPNVHVTNTSMKKAINPPFVPLACPEEGSFIGWKKCLSKDGNVIVKLLIPEDAKRSSATGRKCRASKAVVLDIQTIDDNLHLDYAESWYDETFEYHIGETVQPEEPFDENRFEECASGIHFFITRQEAVDY